MHVLVTILLRRKVLGASTSPTVNRAPLTITLELVAALAKETGSWKRNNEG